MMGVFQNLLRSAVMGLVVGVYYYGGGEYYDFVNRIAAVIGGVIGFLLIPWSIALVVFLIGWGVTGKKNPSLMAKTGFVLSVLLFVVVVMGEWNLWRLGS